MADTRVLTSLAFRASTSGASLPAALEPQANPPSTPGLSVPPHFGTFL